MDAIDRKILALLQEDGRLTVTELPGIQRLNSTLVMKEVVTDRPLPARHSAPAVSAVTRAVTKPAR